MRDHEILKKPQNIPFWGFFLPTNPAQSEYSLFSAQPAHTGKLCRTPLKSSGKMLKWIDKYFQTVAALVIGLFFFYHEYGRPTLKTPSDLLQLQGRLKGYSFKIVPSGKNDLKQYYIWLDRYPCLFQVKADLIPFFSQKRFEKELKKGDIIKFTIPKEFENQIWERDENVFILSATKGTVSYLSLSETIPDENNHADIYIGLFFIIVGLGY